ncbi:TadE family protein [Solicola gregarius]|uniref:Pilus assembly protein n=1 Tax=Solicola gregarius TaxID=2908642 RepID=A0AA46YJE3_9ACTN|nr:TadE family protein [Solicola gregarius]UYM03371.1 pilus assembly protein [Solicola gregarius]
MARRSESGMVTVETAVVIPVLIVLTLVLAWIVSLGIAQVRLVDAAREAARMTARGDSESKATQLAERIAPDGSVVEIDSADGVAEVRVKLVVRTDLPLVGKIGAVDLDATASSVTEAGAS